MGETFKTHRRSNTISFAPSIDKKMSKFITFLCALVLMVQFLESNGMSVDRRNGMINIAKQGFAICNTDGQDGLTWTEIKDCEDMFCSVLSFPCPDEKDFIQWDSNQDGILTFEEWANTL